MVISVKGIGTQLIEISCQTSKIPTAQPFVSKEQICEPGDNHHKELHLAFPFAKTRSEAVERLAQLFFVSRGLFRGSTVEFVNATVQQVGRGQGVHTNFLGRPFIRRHPIYQDVRLEFLVTDNLQFPPIEFALNRDTK